MKRFYCILLSVASGIISVPAFAQPPSIMWEQCSQASSIRCAAKVSDTSFVQAIMPLSCSGVATYQLQCCNKQGAVLWTKDFSEPGQDIYVSSLAVASSGKIFISGFMSTNGLSVYHFITKTDADGDTIWTKKYFFGNSTIPFAGKVIPVSGGGCCYAGNMLTSGNSDVQVLLLDGSGNTLWNKTFGGSDDDYASDVTAVSDGYLIAATAASVDSDVTGNHGMDDAWLLKLDLNGNVLWKKCYGGSGYDAAKGIVQVSPHRFVIAANSTSNDGDVSGHHGSTAAYDYFLFAVNEDGTLLWKNSFGGSSNDLVSQMAALSANELAVLGSSYSTDGNVHNHHGTTDKDDQWAVGIDSLGNLLWDNSIGGTDYDHAHAMAVMDSAAFISGGSGTSTDGDHEADCSDSTCYNISSSWNALLNAHCSSFAAGSFTYTNNSQTFQFNNTSSNATTYNWDFGDGSSSSATNPSHTYSVNNILTVCLTASNDCSSDVNCQPVATCKTLQPKFGYSCYGLQVSFSDSTQLAAKWKWTFGDGDTDSVHNPVHVYAVNGDYSVKLTVYDSCGSSYTKNKTISTCTGLIAGYSTQPSGNEIQFTDTSIGEPDGWSWDFGDGGSSSLQNPTHLFPDNNQYNVCLTISNSHCAATNTYCKNVSTCTTSAIAGFDMTGHDYQVTFLNTSQNATAYFWDFGDGATSTEFSPVHTYPTGVGIYNSKLIASDNCGSDTSTKTIYMGLGPVIANFTFTILGLSVSFSNLSTNAVSYHWDFGDGTTSTTTNPFHTYTANGLYNVCLIAYDQLSNADTLCQLVSLCSDLDADFTSSANNLDVSFTDQTPNATQWLWNFGDGNVSAFENPTHTYASNGTYDVCLTATNICGQSDTLCKTITVCSPLNSNFGYTQTYLNVVFSDSSAGASSWLWSFGDGNTSTSQNPVHNYGSSGDYEVCLVTLNICNASSSHCDTITVCNPVVANYSFSTNYLDVTFTDLTPAATHWNWDFGDGATSSQQNPSHTFASNGTYNVCLIAKNVCGYADTICKSITVCAPLVALFGADADHLTVSFSDSTANANGWTWYFGDGQTSTQQNPTHIYAAAGTYSVCMVAGDVCSNSAQSCMNITVCDTFTTQFSASGFYLTEFFTAQTPTAVAWQWDFGDGNTSTSENPVHSYSSNGVYHACLTATDDCGYNDTLCQDITVCAPLVASFSHTDSFLTVSFNALTATATSWQWDFGDGSFSSDENPIHTYSTNGVYNACLVVNDLCGQSDTICQTVVVCAQLIADFTWEQNNLTVSFTDLSPNTLQWFWDFGDGGISTDENPVHIFPSLGQYQVCLIVLDLCGSDTICQTVDVQCPSFAADFSYAVNAASVQFTDESINSIQWQWDFGDGGNSLLENPNHVFPDTGIYHVCLTAWDSCSSDTFCEDVKIIPVGISENASQPGIFTLFPNPANGTTTLLFTTVSAGETQILLQDVDGRLMKQLAQEHFPSGKHAIVIDLHQLSPGVYFVRKVEAHGVAVKKLVVE